MKSVIDDLVEQAGKTLFWVIYSKADDNSDPKVVNGDYHNQVYYCHFTAR